MKRGILAATMMGAIAWTLVGCGDDAALQNSDSFDVSMDRLPSTYNPSETPVGPGTSSTTTRPDGPSASCDDGSTCAAGQACVTGTAECVPGGAFRVTMVWEKSTDLDLHIKTPLGEEVYYRHRVTADGGEFSKDGCIADRCPEAGPFIETVRWADFATPGTYEIWAVNYDGEESVPFRVEVEFEGQREIFTGTVGSAVGAKSERFAYTIEGAEPRPNSTTQCLQTLDQLGIEWRPWSYSTQKASGQSCTVDDPIIVSGAINGVTYRYYNQNSPGTMSMACDLALALYRAGEVLKEYDIDDVRHIGTFNCRTISGTSTLSKHSHGTAVDFYGFETKSGESLVFERDWQHNTTNPTNSKARRLYEIAQKWHANRVFNIILTPNYNRAHDNHIHADLTPGANTIRSEDEASYYLGSDEAMWEEGCGGHE